MTADEIVKWLDLKPHPEGGHYRETFRDSAGPLGRSHSTAISYLLRAGDPLELSIGQDASVQRTVLGPDLAGGMRPQAMVPAHCWQSARPLGAYTLAGCTVAPGFEFSGFEIAEEGWTPG